MNKKENKSIHISRKSLNRHKIIPYRRTKLEYLRNEYNNLKKDMNNQYYHIEAVNPKTTLSITAGCRNRRIRKKR